MKEEFLGLNRQSISELEYLHLYDNIFGTSLYNFVTMQKGNRDPLYVAIKMGNVDIVEALKFFNVSFNFHHPDGSTPLWNAAKNGNLAIVSSLIKGGARPDFANDDGSSPLHIASASGNRKVVKYLIDNDLNINFDKTNHQGYTALQVAIIHNRPDVVELLIKKGANVFQNNDQLFSLLEPAVGSGSLEIVKLLIDAGITIYPNVNHDFLLQLAVLKGHYNVADLLIEVDRESNFLNDNCLLVAAYKGDYDKVAYFLKQNDFINHYNSKKWTPMHLAALKGHTDIVDLLIKHNSMINTFNLEGETPLIVAAKKGHSYIVSLLISAGADVNLAKCDSMSALWGAVENNHEDVVGLLLRAGAKKELVDSEGITILQLSVFSNYPSVASSLLKAYGKNMTEYYNILPYLDDAQNINMLEEMINHCLSSDSTRECLTVLRTYKSFLPVVDNLVHIIGDNEL